MRVLLFFISFIVLASACGGTLDVVSGGPDGGAADSSTPDGGPPDGASPDIEWSRQVTLTRDEAELRAGLGRVLAGNETTIVSARTLDRGWSLYEGTTVIVTFERRDDTWVRMPELSLERKVEVNALALHGDILFVSYAVWGHGGYDHQGVLRFRRDGTRWMPMADLLPLAEQRICALAVNEDGRALIRYESGMLEIYDTSSVAPKKEYAGSFIWKGRSERACPADFSHGVAAITTETDGNPPLSDLVTVERKDGQWTPHIQRFQGVLHDLAFAGDELAVVEAKVDGEPVALAVYAKDTTETWVHREDVISKRYLCGQCSVAARGSQILFGYDSLETTLFEKKDGKWSETRSFPAPPESAPYSMGYGYTLALMGEDVLLGAEYATVTAQEEGAIYLYERGYAGGKYDDAYKRTLSASPTYQFGSQVAFSRQEMLVADNTKVFVYDLDAQGNPVYRDAFKHQKSEVSRATVANDDTLVSTVYTSKDLYVRRRLEDGHWGPSEMLKATVPVPREGGTDLAIDDDTIAELVPWHWPWPPPVEHYVPVFRRTASGYTQEAVLNVPTPESGKYTGRDVLSLSKGRILVAGQHAETARVYVRDPAGQWSVESDLALSKGADVYTAGAIDGDRLVLVALTDEARYYAAYVFERNGSTWRETARIRQPPRDYYHGAALSGDYLAVKGNLGVHLYRWQKGEWTLQRRIAGEQSEGSALLFWRDRLAVGVPNENIARQSGSGAAYLFYR
ncbi:hypothetical protein LZC95_04220 [Pendulispora brunnea]|uniref:Uncharacterized protein n=1 Tax=Pendulispora brunnea TaxID=2905690 RepID=A0ABZ2KBN3_9BACT